MLLFVILDLISSTILSDVINITHYNYKDYIGGKNFILLKFCDPKDPKNGNYSEMFEEVNEMFTKIVFANIDCNSFKSFCIDKFGIESYPTVKIYSPHNESGKFFEGEFTTDNLAIFIEQLTAQKPRCYNKNFLELNTLTYDSFLRKNPCAFVAYHSSRFEHQRKFIREVRDAVRAFIPQDNVSIGVIRCDKTPSLCQNQSYDGFPYASLFVRGKEIIYSDLCVSDMIISFINDNCGTYRNEKGFLSDDFGLVDEATSLVYEFFLSGNNKDIIKKISAIQGAEYYATVLKYFIEEGGISCILRHAQSIKKQMEVPNQTWKNKDTLKAKYNVIMEVIHLHNMVVNKYSASSGEL